MGALQKFPLGNLSLVAVQEVLFSDFEVKNLSVTTLHYNPLIYDIIFTESTQLHPNSKERFEPLEGITNVLHKCKIVRLYLLYMCSNIKVSNWIYVFQPVHI